MITYSATLFHRDEFGFLSELEVTYRKVFDDSVNAECWEKDCVHFVHGPDQDNIALTRRAFRIADYILEFECQPHTVIWDESSGKFCFDNVLTWEDFKKWAKQHPIAD